MSEIQFTSIGAFNELMDTIAGFLVPQNNLQTLEIHKFVPRLSSLPVGQIDPFALTRLAYNSTNLMTLVVTEISKIDSRVREALIVMIGEIIFQSQYSLETLQLN